MECIPRHEVRVPVEEVPRLVHDGRGHRQDEGDQRPRQVIDAPAVFPAPDGAAPVQDLLERLGVDRRIHLPRHHALQEGNGRSLVRMPGAGRVHEDGGVEEDHLEGRRRGRFVCPMISSGAGTDSRFIGSGSATGSASAKSSSSAR